MKLYTSPFTPEQEKFIKSNCTSKYIKHIAEDLGLSYTQVYNFIQANNLKQKKVQRNYPSERRVQHVKKGKVMEGFFDVNAKVNWAI